MAERTVSDVLVDRLREWGVDRVFGYSGDGIDGVLGALRRAGDPVFVQARHEENAAFMAVGHAKYTGGPRGCPSTPGPGALHPLQRAFDAQLGGKTVVARGGPQAPTALGRAHPQGIDPPRGVWGVWGP